MSFSNNEQIQKFERMEIADLDPLEYRSKNIKFITIVLTIIVIVVAFIIAIPLVTFFINSKFIETKWNKTFIQLNEKYIWIDVKLEKWNKSFIQLIEKNTRLEVKLENLENNLQKLEIEVNRTKGMTSFST